MSNSATMPRKILMFDYDGTLTVDRVFPESTRQTIIDLKKRNLAILGIVSGRELAYLNQVNNMVGGAFNFLVAENGAVAYFFDSDETVIRGREWTQKARIALADADFHLLFFEIIASSRRENAQKISSLLNNAELDAKLVANKDSVMVLPPQVDKGTGVALAVSHYGATKDIQLTCFGDGENDVALFGPADTTVAVSNAVDDLKTIADYVASKPGGYGVEEYIKEKFLE